MTVWRDGLFKDKLFLSSGHSEYKDWFLSQTFFFLYFGSVQNEGLGSFSTLLLWKILSGCKLKDLSIFVNWWQDFLWVSKTKDISIHLIFMRRARELPCKGPRWRTWEYFNTVSVISFVRVLRCPTIHKSERNVLPNWTGCPNYQKSGHDTEPRRPHFSQNYLELCSS